VISTFLAGDPALSRVLLVFVVVAVIVVGLLLKRGGPVAQVGLRVAAILALVAVLAFTLSPAGDNVRGSCNFDVGSTFFIGIERFANTALLVPVAYLGALATTRPVVIFAAGSLLSALIEALQLLVPALGRACDINDWLTNTLGAGVGALLAGVVLAVFRRR